MCVAVRMPGVVSAWCGVCVVWCLRGVVWCSVCVGWYVLLYREVRSSAIPGGSGEILLDFVIWQAAAALSKSPSKL